VKWKKLGKVFDPTEHVLPWGRGDFAQSPQALVFDDFVRVYFSSRVRDVGQKYLSHIAFVDMEKDLGRVISVCTRNVIPLGVPGAFDEHGIFPFNVVRDGSDVRAYIGGWSRRVSVSVDGSIGLAVSRDGGTTFERLGPGPILTASLHEPFLIGDPFVAQFGGVHHMWYIFGTRWIVDPAGGASERVYKLAHAISTDGIAWTREGRQIVPDRLNEDECQALPTVAWLDGKYRMYFCYRQAVGFRSDPTRAYRIGHAYSDDLEHWTRDDAGVGIETSREGWDSDMMCYPHVFHCEGKAYLLYNGNQFGRFGFGAAEATD